MSAFIVEDKTINRVLSWLGNPRIRHENPYLLNRVLEVAVIEQDAEDWAERLGVSMMHLNCDAVDQRYDEHNPVAYRHQHEQCVTSIQALKSLRCWLYQCSEGDVPERELYQAFDKLSGEIAMHIINRMPEYDKADWA